MAKKTISVVYPCAVATNEKVIALTDAVRTAAQSVGFADFAIPTDALLDFPPVAKDLHGRWKAAETDLKKKKLPEKDSINASLVRQANGTLACAFHATIGTADKAKSAPPEEFSDGHRYAVKWAEITVWLNDARAAEFHATRRTVIDAATEAGLRGFTFPLNDTFLAGPLQHLPAAAQTHADTISSRSGFAMLAGRWYTITATEGRVGFRFMSGPISDTTTTTDDIEEAADGLDFSLLRLHCTKTVTTVFEATAETVGDTIAATTGDTTQTVAESFVERLFKMFGTVVRNVLNLLRR